ncbi:MAG TPA: transporter substrate-binding domain-containing protein [Desulfobulbaceae bacterium]|nr:transporter substrate-binding domain-containing protein [Desulfobulbaceae bacterium]
MMSGISREPLHDMEDSMIKKHASRFFLVMALLLSSIFPVIPSCYLCPAHAAGGPADEDGMETLIRQKMMGDYPEMVKHRIIRALVPPSKTFFFVDQGQRRGLTYEALMHFEKFINKRLKNKHLQVKIITIPTSRKNLLPDLIAGYGDIAAGNLTITPGRSKRVDFSTPLLTGINEIIVTHGPGPDLHSIFDLAGRKVFVRKNSSYYESLQRLNTSLHDLGKKSVRIELVDDYLEDEDLLEMVNAGLIPMIVVDQSKGELWAKIFSNIKLHPKLKLRTGGNIAWAVRKTSPKLKKIINTFVHKNKKGTLTGNILYNRYLKRTDYLRNNISVGERKKFGQTVNLFKKYGRKYDFPYLLLTALAYQESGLDQKKRSHDGAIGIMQVLPKTASDKNIGIHHINKIENNIHAGSKYLRFVKNRYFSDDSLDELNSDLFTIAAYNAGPARIAKLRREAKQRGLDPNVWFNNVEVIAARRIGRETVRYVSNIYKYYVAYKRIEQQEARKLQEKRKLKNKHDR